MIKDIHYQGLSVVPDDYQSQDGQLTSAINLIPEDNQLRPLFQPSVVFTPDPDLEERIVYIHSTRVFSHFIIQDKSGLLSWIDSNRLSIRHAIYQFDASASVLKISTIGNTLCVLCSDGLHYIIYRSPDNGYRYLGQKPPQLNLAFSLSDSPINTLKSKSLSNGISHIAPESASTLSPALFLDDETSQKALANDVWTIINRTNAYISSQGNFYAPFFVRYCYRLFDGSCFMHSAPVFMAHNICNFSFSVSLSNASVSQNPSPSYTYTWSTDDGFGLFRLHYNYHSDSLHYHCLNDLNELLDSLDLWSDIVKSVDIFVSAPIIHNIHDEPISSSDTDFILQLPSISDYERLNSFRNIAPLYKVASLYFNSEIYTDNILQQSGSIKSLDNLTSQESMPSATANDDYKSHNIILPSFNNDNSCNSSLLNYNAHLHISSINEKLFSGFPIECLLQQDFHESSNGQDSIIIDSIVVSINTNDGVHNVIHYSSYPDNGIITYPDSLFISRPLFYPDSRASKLTIYFHHSDYILNQYPQSTQSANSGQRMATFDLYECPLINGASSIPNLYDYDIPMNSLPALFSNSAASILPSINDISSEYNLLFSSEINNPFFFPASKRISVGSGHILAISSAAKALSQGQFGQFPLYAFCTDGVWALSVSSSGTFSAVNPITRDVCINSNSITQLDSSVLFATNRGIMLIQGSNSTCITNQIASETPFDILSKLPKLSQLTTNLSWNISSPSPFLSFLDGCRMLYDYIHQRIIVFNPTKQSYTKEIPGEIVGYENGDPIYGPITYQTVYTNTPLFSYAYVYSLKSNQWGMMYSDLAYPLNSYPDALAVNASNKLVSFSLPHSSSDSVKSLLVTRPIKLDTPNSLKSIRSLILRGLFKRGNVQTVLYGSRDLYSWHLIGSSSTEAIRTLRGSPYKYFRIAAVTTFSEDMSLSGITIDFQPRHNNLLL